MRKKNIIIIAFGTLFILLLISLADQLYDEVNWKIGDFIVMGILLLSAGLTYAYLTLKIISTAYRVAVAFVIMVLFLLIWAELAVGIFGTPFAGS